MMTKCATCLINCKTVNPQTAEGSEHHNCNAIHIKENHFHSEAPLFMSDTETLISQLKENSVFINLDLISGMKYVYLLTENSLVKVGVLRKIFRFLEIHITE